MKFQVSKHDTNQCKACGGYILRGKDMVLTFMNKPEYAVTLCYHTECYIPWYTAMFNQKWNDWKHGSGATRRPHVGHPVVIQNASRAVILNRLRATRTYHTKTGNIAKVEAINQQIDQIKHPR
jgi:hypothetical protein